MPMPPMKNATPTITGLAVSAGMPTNKPPPGSRQRARFVRRRTNRARCLLPGGGLFVGIPALTANPVIVGVAFFIGGMGIVSWNVVTVSFRQQITPDRLLGRVNSCYRLVAWGTMPLGAAVGGLLGQALGLRAVFALMAALTLALCLGMLIVTDSRMDAAEHEADQGLSAGETLLGRVADGG